jgi:hypothetical protein
MGRVESMDWAMGYEVITSLGNNGGLDLKQEGPEGEEEHL